ncbi:hypothetical protein AX15_005300 [Amanita polypyramis BW_CC]|nr:hypothetical protein AX15_005300 [Amanita polypyramis BW_CC]
MVKRVKLILPAARSGTTAEQDPGASRGPKRSRVENPTQTLSSSSSTISLMRVDGQPTVVPAPAPCDPANFELQDVEMMDLTGDTSTLSVPPVPPPNIGQDIFSVFRPTPVEMVLDLDSPTTDDSLPPGIPMEF